MTSTPGVPPTDGAQRTASSNLFSILAIVFGAVAVLFIPILFGIAAIVLAAIALNKKEPLAKVAMTVAIIGTIAGFALGAIVYSSNN